MYALTLQRGENTEIVVASENIIKLREKMKEEILAFLAEVYGDDEDAFDWLMPISDTMLYWSDEDEEYPTTYRIEEFEVI